MNLVQEILALLKAQFSGVREDGLLQLASGLALQCTTKEEATALVGKLTAEKVEQFVKDWRKVTDAEISKANTTFENSLKEKYDFVEKGKQPPTPPTPPTEPQTLTVDAVKQLIAEGIGGLQKSLTEMATSKTAEQRKGVFVAALDKAKIQGTQRDVLLKNYDRMSFKDDADFTSFMTEQTAQLATLAQEEADKGLLQNDKPIFGAVNKDGISEGVADYIKAKADESSKPTLTGKAI